MGLRASSGITRAGQKDIILRPVHPNCGIEAAYRRRLRRLIEEMNDSFLYWIKAAYRAHPPATATMAMDESSAASQLRIAINKLTRQWKRNFDEAANELAKYFALAAHKRSDAVLRQILRKGGFSVRFKMTPAMKDVMKATIAEQVGLIKSIPQQYLVNVQGAVMRSVAAGRDLAPLAKEIEKQYGVTRRRAALIARDQNNKATASMTRVRQVELGIKEAVWLHSHGGRVPRPTHLANDGKRYDTSKGWFDPDPKVRRFIFPGELINCFPASTRIDFATNVEKAFRHFYSGQLAEIVTDSGKTLGSTPNHPILTPDGWRPIGSLDEGDYVIEVADHAIDAVKLKGDVDGAIPLIAEIFVALAEMRFSQVSLGDEFHGDAIANGDIDVVFPARPLSFGRKFLDAKSFKKFGLAMPDEPAFRQSPFSQLTISALDAANSVMSGARERLSFLGRSILHPHIHSFAAIADSPAYSLDPAFDYRSLVPELPGKREQASAVLVQRAQPARIIGVKRRRFSAHVFNLQTRDGYYGAEGIICHNCRCVSKSIIKGFS